MISSILGSDMSRDSWIVGLGFKREVCSCSKAWSMFVKRESHVILVFCPSKVYNVRICMLILLRVLLNPRKVPMISKLLVSFPER